MMSPVLPGTAVPLCVLLVISMFVSLAGSRGAYAHSYKLNGIAVGHIWAPPQSDADGIAVYGPILNRTGSTIHLIGASTPIAKTVKFRTNEKGKRAWQEAVDLPPGKPLALAPWRVHIWIADINPLEVEDDFPLTLDFGRAGKLDVKVVVEKSSGH